MNKQIEELALRVAKEMPNGFLWSEGCDHESGIVEQEILDFSNSFLAELAKQSEPVGTPFECWSTNEGDSWYEHPADAELLYDLLGGDPKVGDEFEVMAGWISVQARYRISSKQDDDFEVECISHPNDNIPQADLVAEIERLKVDHKEACDAWCKQTHEVSELRQQLSAAQRNIERLEADNDGLVKALEVAVKLNSFREFNDHIPAMKAAIAAHKARQGKEES